MREANKGASAGNSPGGGDNNNADEDLEKYKKDQ